MKHPVLSVTSHALSRTARAAVGRAAIRRVHRMLCARLGAALDLDDAAFQSGFAGVVAAVEAGLRHEEAILDRLGQATVRDCIADNAVLLRALHRVLPLVEAGDTALGRDAIGALRDVLALRRLACDVALAAMASPVHNASLRLQARRRVFATRRLHRPRLGVHPPRQHA